MSIADVIARLQVAANNGAASAPLTQARQALVDTAIPLLMQSMEQLAEIRNSARTALDGQPNSQAEVEGAAEHAAGAIEDALALVQAAETGVQQALEHEGAFRRSVLDVSDRLAGG